MNPLKVFILIERKEQINLTRENSIHNLFLNIIFIKYINSNYRKNANGLDKFHKFSSKIRNLIIKDYHNNYMSNKIN